MREAAALRGRLDAGLSREELFPEPPLSLAFAAAEEHWIGELAEDLDRGHFERVLEYQTAYLEARGPIEDGEAAAPEATAPAAAAPAAVPAPAAAIGLPEPEAERPKPDLRAVQLATVDVDATGETDVRAILVGLRNQGIPFVDSAEPSAPPPVAEAALSQPQASSTGTDEVDVSELRRMRPAVPFASKAAVSPSTAPAIDLDATGAVDVSKIREALLSGATPFGAPEELPMPVARIAQLAATLAVAADREAVFRQFAVTADEWLSVAQKLGKRLASDPVFKAQYEQLLREAASHVR